MGANMSPEDDIYSLALLMDELKHVDVANRMEAMQKLYTIGNALGPERCRKELIPFLVEVAQDDEDEVFLILADQLGKFTQYVGGVEYATVLLSPLEILASAEEVAVREKAVASLNNIAQELSEEQLFNNFLPLIQNLATADWFSAKVSACGLFKSVIVRIKDDTLRFNTLSLYLHLIEDETPMVRRSASKNLPNIIDLFSQNSDLATAEDWNCISTMFQRIMEDNQDSVKFLAVDCLISILKYFNKKQDFSNTADLLESTKKLISDDSWRVRYMIADKFEDVANQFSHNEAYINSLVEPFIGLCEDSEADIRKAIAKQLPGFAKLLNNPTVVLEKIFPIIRNLSMDDNEATRSSLALTITNIADVLNKQQATDHLIPVLLDMLKDEFPDVRLNIIGNLKAVYDVVGPQLLSEALLPAITELANDMNWRVRLAIIKYIPILAEQLGEEFFDKQLRDLCLSWLWDTVYSIRSAAIQNIKRLTEIFGDKWCQEEIISKLLKFDTQLLENFVYRFTLLSALTEIVPVVSEKTTVDDILPFINHLANDAVPNIRFNVAKSYAVIVESFNKDISTYQDPIKNTIIPALKTLTEDQDVDVKYFATQSLEKCQRILD